MKTEVGISVVGEVILYEIEMGGAKRYFENAEDGIMASAVRDENKTPVEVRTLKLSDGTYVLPVERLIIGVRPNEEAIAALMDNLTPAQKILYRRKKSAPAE